MKVFPVNPARGGGARAGAPGARSANGLPRGARSAGSEQDLAPFASRDRPVAAPLDLRSDEGFERFVAEAVARLRGFLARRGVPYDDLDDLLQDVFLAVWRNRQRVRPAKAVPFALSVAHRLCLAYWREEAQHFATLQQEGTRILLSRSASSAKHEDEDPGAGRLRAKRLRTLLDGLRRRHREIIDLVWMEGIQRTEAARVMAMSPNVLRVLEGRVLRRLQNRVRAARKVTPGNVRSA